MAAVTGRAQARLPDGEGDALVGRMYGKLLEDLADLLICSLISARHQLTN